MELHEFGDWIKIGYWSGESSYHQSLPKDLSDLYSIGYFSNGLLHRIDKPALIGYYKGGTLQYESYYLNGLHHRVDGPAVTYYYDDGKVELDYYWLYGNYYTEEEWEKEIATL